MYLPGIYTVNGSGLVLNPPDLRRVQQRKHKPLAVERIAGVADGKQSSKHVRAAAKASESPGLRFHAPPLRPQLTALHTLLVPALFSQARGDSSRPSGVTVHACVQAEALWEAISHQDVSVARPLTPSSAMWSASCGHHLRSRI